MATIPLRPTVLIEPRPDLHLTPPPPSLLSLPSTISYVSSLSQSQEWGYYTPKPAQTPGDFSPTMVLPPANQEMMAAPAAAAGSKEGEQV